MTMVRELVTTRVPEPLVNVSVEAPAVSPTRRPPALMKPSLPFRKAKVVAPLVAIRPVLALLRRSSPLVNVVVPDVCHDSRLVLLKTELDAPDRSMRPVIRPALLMVIGPDAAVTATASSAARPPVEAMRPVPLLLRVIAPAEVLPTAAV